MAIALAKRSFNADSDSIRGVSNFALHALKMFYDTPESKEGVAAFNEKRTPDFNKFSSRFMKATAPRRPGRHR
jgi:2-ketocyclohexanecarboxyl-CoA hydrolase